VSKRGFDVLLLRSVAVLLLAGACCAAGRTEDATAPSDAATEDDDEAPDRENKSLVKKTYDVRAYLRCPLGRIAEVNGQRAAVPDTASDDWFLGPQTALGVMIAQLLVGYTWEPGVNHFARQAGALEITNTTAAHRDVERILSALAAMPAMNPQARGTGLDADRCVHICTTSLSEGEEPVESVLYDVSDIVLKMTPIQLETLIQGIDRQTWGDAGGPGSVMHYEAARAMAVVQTSAVHEKIKNGLAQTRGVNRKLPKPMKKPRKVKS
jgi:hypothetical protein